ncbi:TPA: hypothetical protein N0F65_002726 [Lagenidium giganteum]|uniref:RNA-dependent RNA polymerase n=1 Tax=Lagenidium giganteum TaxID=4803 RepID=A0AAV2Z545_9STRA|nr:TPA: hypothetical protein N0F65_002726 [Lagenidium giganteum]
MGKGRGNDSGNGNGGGGGVKQPTRQQHQRRWGNQASTKPVTKPADEDPVHSTTAWTDSQPLPSPTPPPPRRNGHQASAPKTANKAATKPVNKPVTKPASKPVVEDPAQAAVACVSNLPPMAVPDAVVHVLETHAELRGQILGCELRLDQRGCSSGAVYVALRSTRALRTLFGLAKRQRLCWKRHELLASRVSRSTEKRVLRLLAQNQVASFELQRLSVGTRMLDIRSATEPFVTRWTTTDAVSLLVGHRCIAFEFGSEYRIEFAVEDLRHQLLAIDDNSGLTWRAVTDRPPRCFRLRETTHAPDLMDATDWMRTVDLSMTGAMGWCSMVECVFLSEAAGEDAHLVTKLMSRMAANGVHCNAELVDKLVSDAESLVLPTSSRICHTRQLPIFSHGSHGVDMDAFRTEVMRRAMLDRTWHRGFDRVLEALPFRLRFLLDALIARQRLWFPRLSDATHVAHAFLQSLDRGMLSMDGAFAALEGLYMGAPRRDPVQAVIDIARGRHQRARNNKVSATTSGSHSNDKDTSGTDSVGGGGVQVKDDDDDGYMEILRVLVTPLRVCPQWPTRENSNRVLRAFRHVASRFLRVAFVDEDGMAFNRCKSDDMMELRLRPLVTQGLRVAGRRYVFLAYSSSQLREQSCWFYDEEPRPEDAGKSTSIPTANDIRQAIGDLSTITTIAKFGARLGQAFSDTKSTVKVADALVSSVPDVCRNDYVFSDGVGLISSCLAELVAVAMHLLVVPSAFQIRFRGAKGVVSVWPSAFVRAVSTRNAKLVLRPSMTKFVGNAQHRQLEVCSVARSLPCYLNRQVIALLSSLGIADDVFLQLLHTTLQSLRTCMASTNGATALVATHAPDSLAYDMLASGMNLSDRFVWQSVTAIQRRCLVDVQERARLPVAKGATLMGILDETGELPEDTVFFQLPNNNEARYGLKHGAKVLVGRSPCLHPGDVRVLTLHTEGVSALSHLVDVLVFSQHGQRPACNMMAGGGLDGDQYFVIWDSQLLPQQSFPPMVYEHSGAHPTATTSKTVTPKDLQTFFVDYVQNDVLGVVAHAHLAQTDQNSAFSPACLALAQIHSAAVDFAKTGVPARMKPEFQPKAFPTYMNKPSLPSYESTTVLGLIYKLSQELGLSVHAKATEEDDELDPALLAEGREAYVDDALRVLHQYVHELRVVATRFGVYDEGELVSGFARQFSWRASSRQRGGHDLAEKLRFSVERLRRKYAQVFWREFVDVPERSSRDNVRAKASAWYQCAYTQHHDTFGLCRSFAWVVPKPLLDMKQQGLEKLRF